MFNLFSKNPKTVPELNTLQRAIFMYTEGFFRRKVRKYYLKSHACENLQFESQKVKDALARLSKNNEKG